MARRKYVKYSQWTRTVNGTYFEIWECDDASITLRFEKDSLLNVAGDSYVLDKTSEMEFDTSLKKAKPILKKYAHL